MFMSGSFVVQFRDNNHLKQTFWCCSNSFLQRENKSVGLYSKQTEHTMLSELKTQLKSWRPRQYLITYLYAVCITVCCFVLAVILVEWELASLWGSLSNWPCWILQGLAGCPWWHHSGLADLESWLLLHFHENRRRGESPSSTTFNTERADSVFVVVARRWPALYV